MFGNNENGFGGESWDRRDEGDAERSHGPWRRECEERIVALLSGLGWMQSRDRAHRAVRRLCAVVPLERFEAWLEVLACVAEGVIEAGRAGTPFDALLEAVDPFDRLSIDELARAISSTEAIERFAARARCDAPRQSRASAERPADLAPDGRLRAFQPSAFACEMFQVLRCRLSPDGFGEVLTAIEQASAVYPTLKPKYCDSGPLEFVRELRGVLRRRWQFDGFTPGDVAAMVDLELIDEVGQSMSTRCQSK
ncbi:MAG: hypothetical protein H6812_10550 [Phycisphaeraceae bacterium]|nr:hypothetical protein [Phycisphaerales bacterium]MCB9843686.1 hypothetical protein [Phycisphaeraceae bacterium]